MKITWKKAKLKSQQRFKSERDIISTIKVNKVALSGNYNEKIKILDCIKISAYGTSKEILDKNKKTTLMVLISAVFAQNRENLYPRNV